MLAGSPAIGLVLINTLRRITPRVAWMNDASLPHGRRVDLAEAGHMLPLETPEPLIAALDDFARGLPA